MKWHNIVLLRFVYRFYIKWDYTMNYDIYQKIIHVIHTWVFTKTEFQVFYKNLIKLLTGKGH